MGCAGVINGRRKLLDSTVRGEGRVVRKSTRDGILHNENFLREADLIAVSSVRAEIARLRASMRGLTKRSHGSSLVKGDGDRTACG